MFDYPVTRSKVSFLTKIFSFKVLNINIYLLYAENILTQSSGYISIFSHETFVLRLGTTLNNIYVDGHSIYTHVVPNEEIIVSFNFIKLDCCKRRGSNLIIIW